MTDEFDGIFENLTPADFQKSSVKYAAETNDRSFGQWVDRQIEATRVAWVAADGMINPFAVMRSADGKSLIFGPDDDESLGQYVQRLTREARDHSAIWFYTVVMTTGGAYEGEQRSIGDPEAVAEAEEQGAMKPCVYFYAETRGDRHNPDAIRNGIITTVDQDLGDAYDSNPEHASPVYRQVLGGTHG